jgi:hypothetical protein
LPKIEFEGSRCVGKVGKPESRQKPILGQDGKFHGGVEAVSRLTVDISNGPVASSQIYSLLSIVPALVLLLEVVFWGLLMIQ